MPSRNNLLRTKQSHQNIVQIMPAVDNVVKNTQINLPSFRMYKNSTRQVQKTENCYVTCVFLSEKYIPSALTLGMSLRKVGVRQNTICMVQDTPYEVPGSNRVLEGVSPKGIKDLLKVFDFVVGCDILSIRDYRPPTQGHFTSNSHYSNIQYYVTKLNILGLTQYKKLFYLDASTMVDKNIDYIFGEFNQSAFFFDVEYKYSHVGLRGTFFLIVTKPFYFKKSIYLINNYNSIFKDYYFCRGIDEVVLFYSIYPNWSKKMIDFHFACNGNDLNKRIDENICKIHYFQILKPFEPILDKSPNLVKQYYENYNKWDEMVRELLTLNPTLQSYFKKIRDFRNANFF